ncbi:MAG: hypothetical protein KatS3mg129_2357 [Leptospiraceae bacterium]|nr:MAG: hypothetical protein KatS3mg129_2357 [Leptospiraceae bacterium]
MHYIELFEFVIKLIENNAYIPFLIECKNGYKILWQPALFNKDIRDIYEKLKTFLPEKSIVYLTHKKKKSYVKDELFFIISYILNHLIKQFSINYHFSDFTSPKSIKIYQLFFKNETINFNDFETKQYPNSIQLWLNRFYLQKDFEIFFLIKENSNSLFYIDIGIRKQNNQIIYLNELDNAELLFKIYKYLNLLETFFPDINIYIKSKGKEKLFYSLENLSKLLFEIIPKLEQIGIEVLLPKSLKELIQPKPTIRIKSMHLTKYMSKDDLKNFDWVIAIGNEIIEIEEFKKLLQQNQEFIKFKEKYIYLSKNDINKLKSFIENPPSINVSEIIHSIFTETYNGSPICINKSTKKQIEEFKKISLISLPFSIRGKLREYQLYGYSWMYKNIKLGFGCILADDMGLGKTLQSIALLAKLKEENLLKKYKALVIIPTTLITNWNNEIQKFCPDLKVYIYHGQKREIENNHYDIVLTTYGVIRSDIEKLSSIRWSIIIIDEAQNIKNPNAQQTKAIKKLKANCRIALSGTPVENRLSEYWSIFDFVNPGYLGSLNQFIQNYARPIEIDHNKNVLEKFKLITTPFLLRRVKTDKNIINDLPEKIENKLYCNLTVEQVSLYKSTVDILFSNIEKLEGINRKGIILKLLLHLKQICNHPSQFTKDKNYDYRRSGKLQLLIQILENIYENDEKVLIFTQYQEMSDILKEILEVQFNKKILQIHGGINSKKRAYIVDLFQNHKQYDTLILTLKAGGVGLNLTAANNVIHYDMWWNPAVENQATDRAYRIGQNKNVMVYKLITKHTLEEKIKEIIDQKKELAEITIEKGEKWIGELSNEELRSIVELTGN